MYFLSKGLVFSMCDRCRIQPWFALFQDSKRLLSCLQSKSISLYNEIVSLLSTQMQVNMYRQIKYK